jgi:2,4-dienoyl-CoA reductase-like NADH-dependent reductase (Old Yellow Enzyme family)
VALRYRVALSPMTQSACGPQGVVTDWHLVHLGARAAGLLVLEQLAVASDGRRPFVRTPALGMQTYEKVHTCAAAVQNGRMISISCWP